MHSITVAIPARNAAKTIRRAVQSALDQGDYPILLIDDWSSDETALIAKDLAGSRISVVRPSEHKALGFARQTGLLHAKTPYLVWLDADDELLPGRLDRMKRCFLQESADIVSDGVELRDGLTNKLRRIAPIPPFLTGLNPLVRQFERNFLPGSAMIGLRISFAREVGYDGDISAAEDSDFLLRSALRNPRVCLLRETGYRMYTYPNSLSRNIENQRAMVRRTLMKHDYRDVFALYLQSGYSHRIAHWALVAMAVFREEFDRALDFLGEVERLMEDPAEILEPGGPTPFPEGWRLGFQRGTLHLLAGRIELAIGDLELAESWRTSAEGTNNLGVAYAKTGNLPRSQEAFARALAIFPGFFDARMNSDSTSPLHITTHPLRVHAARDDYSPAQFTDVSRRLKPIPARP